jgi:hypothetical protein
MDALSWSIVLCLAGAYAVAALLRHRLAPQRRELVERAERDRQAQLRRAVDAGSHLATGERRCSLPDCHSPATVRRVKLVRDEGALDLVRRAMGAAPRFRSAVDPWGELHYCEPHYHLAEQETRLELVERERERIAAMRDAEVKLTHFERVGLDVRLARLVARRKPGAAADVIPIRKAIQ